MLPVIPAAIIVRFSPMALNLFIALGITGYFAAKENKK